MATLNNKKIKDTFKGLLKTLDNAEITGQVEITDGDGNQTGVFINTDGSIKVTGTAEFGSLKDTGEDITITKFVDEADGISNNDDDSSIPTSAAVKDYVDTNVTAQDLDFQGDGGTGAVDLDSQSLDIAGGTGITTTALDQTLTIDIDNTVATLSDTQTLTNKSIDLTDNTITGTTSQFNTALSDDNFATLAGTETLTNKTINADNNTVSNIETDNLKAGVLDTDLSSVSASDDTLASAKAIKTYVDTQITAEDLDFSGNTGSGSVDLDSQTFDITGTGIATTTAANQGLEVNVPATNLSNTPASTTLDVESSTGNNTTLPAATTTNAGVMTGADKTKLDGIETGAEVNVVTSVNTETGDVVLDTDDISEGSTNLYYTEARADARVDAQTGSNLDLSQKSTSDLSEGTNLYYTEARVSANTSVAANTLKNTYPSADATKVGHITVTQAVDLDTLESNVATNNAKISFDSTSSTKLAGIESGAEVNPTSTDELSEGSTNLYYTDARVESNSAVAANTSKVGITTQQASDITTNNAKVSFPEAPNDGDAYVRQSEGWVSLTHPTDAVTSVNGETGVVVLDSDDVTEGTSNLYYTDARVSANSDVTANTAKVGITTQQAADIQTNNAKVGITTAQADEITANTAKNSYPSADATKLAGIEAGAEVNPTSTDELSEGSTNLYYTEARVSANTNVAANTLKNSYPSADATKVGFISVTQAVDLDTIESDVATNNAKVGITTQQANDITANNAKISFDSASSTKLAGIEAGAEVNPTNTDGLSEGSTNLYYLDSRVSDNSDVVANTAKISYNTTDSTKVGYISITQAVDLDSVENKQENQYKVIGVAMDYSNRVLSDSGTAEGTQSIMENIETLILN